MVISTKQLERRLALLNIRVGDVLVDMPIGMIEIVGRADNKVVGVFKWPHCLLCDDIEILIREAMEFFRAQEDTVEPLLIDGRKIPA